MGLIAHLLKQSTDGNGFTSASIDTTGANFLAAAVADADGSSTLTDSKGNSWTKGTGFGTADKVVLWYAKNATVGTAHTFTITATTKYPGIAVAAFDGRDTTAPLDSAGWVGATYGPSSNCQPGSLTPGAANELLLAGWSGDGGAIALTIDSGFTMSDSAFIVGGQAYGVGLAYLIETSIVAKNPQFAWNSGSNGGVVQAAFLAASAAQDTPELYGRPYGRTGQNLMQQLLAQ